MNDISESANMIKYVILGDEKNEEISEKIYYASFFQL